MRARTWLFVVLGVLAAFALAATRTELVDYVDVPSDDNPAPTIAALVDGDFARAAETMPAMGLTSIVLRLPFAALGGDDALWVYRLGSFGCLLLLVALFIVLDRQMERANRPAAYRLAFAVALFIGPIGLASLQVGHPEEIVGGVLCVAAVLAAMSKRAIWAGILLGLAIGTKQWAIVAVPAVLVPVAGPVVFDRQRIVATASAVLVAALTVLPGIAANPDRYRATTGHLASTTRAYAKTLWWPISQKRPLRVDFGGGDIREASVFVLPRPLNRGNTTALAAVMAIALGLRGLRRGALHDPLGVLALLLTARCALDPMNVTYYAVPALLAVAAWEADPRAPQRGIPLATVLAAASIVATSHAADADPALIFALWLLTLAPLLLLRGRGGGHAAQTLPEPA